MAESSAVCLARMEPTLTLSQTQKWKYETDEFTGICEIARDGMVVKCVFECHDNKFFDVLGMDDVIRRRLELPVSVERLAEQLAADFPSLQVTVSGRAKTHGWITSTVGKRFC
ncbi:MAG: hypothetical protein ACKOU6_05145 [Planctomycetota bacterium]